MQKKKTPASPKKKATQPKVSELKSEPTRILIIDIGGSKVKILLAGEHEPRKIPSGSQMTPASMIEAVLKAAQEWEFEAVSIGYPGLVGPMGPRSEPGHLGPGWVGFNFGAAFERPVRIINDAAMQALGSYEGGRMLFLGLGTGLGSTFIADNVIVPLELGRITHRDGQRLGDLLGRAGLKTLGKDAWRTVVREVVASLTDVFMADYIVLGGGNAKVVKEMPPGTRRGNNLTAFRGGLRLWSLEHVPTLSGEEAHMTASPPPGEWRIL